MRWELPLVFNRAGKTLGKPVHIVVNDPSTSIRPLMAGYLNNPDYEPSMFIDKNQAMELVDNNTVVVVVDTNKPSYTECQELLYMTKQLLCWITTAEAMKSFRMQCFPMWNLCFLYL